MSYPGRAEGLVNMELSETLVKNKVSCLKENKHFKKKSSCMKYSSLRLSNPISYILCVKDFYVLGSLNKFPDFFRMGTFIDSTHMKL